MIGFKQAITIVIALYLLMVLFYLFHFGFLSWDQQQALAFSQNKTSIAYNVTALTQLDLDGNGPAYLVNGLSNRGYWYQIGLAYNWASQYGNMRGFYAVYDIFDPSGHVIFPEGGGGGLLNFSGQINPGDTVLLQLSFLPDGNVSLLAKDWNTEAISNFEFSGENATTFVGTPLKRDINGTFTGLMTEWYHLYPNYKSGSKITYVPYQSAQSPAWLITEEQVSLLHAVRWPVFVQNSSAPVAPDENYVLNIYNTTEQYLNNGTFITRTS